MNSENQTDSTSQPAQQFMINDLETLKVISDALRLEILDMLHHHPHSVKQLSEKLAVTPHKLYYHINLLEKHGLIQVAETRVVSGIIEKLYRVTAGKITVSPDLLSSSAQVDESLLDTLVGSVLTSTQNDIRRSVRQGLINPAKSEDRNLYIHRALSRLTAEQVEHFKARLEDLIAEFNAAEDTSDASGQQYSLTFLYYPSAQTGE